MKSIKQSVEVQFRAVEIGDVVKLLPIMDAISLSLDKEKELELTIGDESWVTFSIEYLKEAYATLKNLGFCNSKVEDPKIISQPDKD